MFEFVLLNASSHLCFRLKKKEEEVKSDSTFFSQLVDSLGIKTLNVDLQWAMQSDRASYAVSWEGRRPTGYIYPSKYSQRSPAVTCVKTLIDTTGPSGA